MKTRVSYAKGGQKKKPSLKNPMGKNGKEICPGRARHDAEEKKGSPGICER